MIIVQLDSEQLDSLIQNALRKVISENPKAEQPTETDELLTVQDTAKFLSLSVPTVYGLISKGELPVMKRSKRCYFSKVELINYLKQGRRKTLAETATEAEQYCKTKKG
jgi:excisionase family DNA binding protein